MIDMDNFHFSNPVEPLNELLEQRQMLIDDLGLKCNERFTFALDELARSAAECLKPFQLEDYSWANEHLARAFSEQIEQLQELSGRVPINDAIYNAFAPTIAAIERLTQTYEGFESPEEKVETADSIQIAVQATVRKKWSVEEIVSIMGLLITIVTFFLQVLPNQQLDQLAGQNSILIAQQSQLLENAQRENESLVDAVKALSETARALSDEIDALKEQSSDLNDNLQDSADTDDINPFDDDAQSQYDDSNAEK